MDAQAPVGRARSRAPRSRCGSGRSRRPGSSTARCPRSPTRAPAGDPRLADAGEPQQPPGLLDVAAAAATTRPTRPTPTPTARIAPAPSRNAAAVALSADRPAAGRAGRGRAWPRSARCSGSVSSERHDQPGHEADQPPAAGRRGRSRAAPTATPPSGGERREDQRRRPPRARRASRPAQAKSSAESSSTPSDQERLVVVCRGAEIGILGDRAGGEPDDELGDGDDRRLADGHRHRRRSSWSRGPARPATSPASDHGPAERRSRPRLSLRHDHRCAANPYAPRVGIGTDVHRLVDGVPLHLAGLAWPDEPQGLEGHSDADVAAHAACDALLSAAGLGDLGSQVRHASRSGPAPPAPRCSPRPRAGCARPASRSATSPSRCIGNRPRLGPRRAEAEAALSAAAGAPVTVSATTTDGLGLTGRGEGVAAIATALVGAG